MGPRIKEIKKVTNKPVFVIGRINDPSVAESLLDDGAGDVISMARQLIADPEFANKAREGKAMDIRSCVGVNYCWSYFTRGLRIQCIQNPAVGREKIRGMGTLSPAEKQRGILIIGGGAAGLEVARTSALRSHDVLLCEKEKEVGGRLLVESRLPGRGEVIKISTWLESQARKAGAEIKTSEEVTERNIESYIHDRVAIVLATGSQVMKMPLTSYLGDVVPGSSSSNVSTFEDVLTGKSRPDGRVLIFDALGDVTAIGIAELLSSRGAEVVLATWSPLVGWELNQDWTLDYSYEQIAKCGVRMIANVFMQEIKARSVVLADVFTGREEETIPADQVVLVSPRLSDNHLTRIAKEVSKEVHVVGDAVAPRGTYTAIFEGHRLGRAL